jgi:hypothetical protein
VELRQFSHAQGGEGLLLTDGEADRQLSLRAASSIPLPPEIAMMEAKDASRYHHWSSFYELMGVSDHPVVMLLSDQRRRAGMAAAVSHAPYLERISHLNSWLGGETVRIFDLAGGGGDAN